MIAYHAYPSWLDCIETAMSSLDRLNFFTRVSRYEYLSLQSTQAVFLKSSGLLEI
jgi:hypothetical protein